MVTITNLTSESFPRREEFEAAVRQAFADAADAYEITLRDGPETVVVEVRKGAASVFAYLPNHAGPAEIIARLRTSRL